MPDYWSPYQTTVNGSWSPYQPTNASWWPNQTTVNASWSGTVNASWLANYTVNAPTLGMASARTASASTVDTWHYWADMRQTQTAALSQRTQDAWRLWQEVPAKRARGRHEGERQILIRRNRAHTSKLRERVAQRRARDLLMSMLDEVQAEQWRAERAFTIETADGARRYRIRHGIAGNIMLVKDGDREAPAGSWLRRFCFHAYHPDGQIPVEDHVLAQKLYIEANEEDFLRLANPA